MLLELIGEFDVVSGEVVVSDPCYSLGTWCAGDLKAVNGRWAASVERQQDRGMGERIGCLVVRHVDCPEGELWIPVSITVGVDSGQAGVFDATHYKDDTLEEAQSLTEPLLPDEPWYSLCCNRTLSEKEAGVIPFGAVSSSGYGDGVYNASAIFDAEGRALAVRIIFIDDEYDDEYDEYDEEWAWDEEE